ncbi:hypothetical protein ACH5RR_009373 [Cinchona calisaya]|uniref:Uncharacterized protein n=1 Tax=Cinchona calisaya TaxID=153742 RepID=A0ABD3AGG8_9GENT
MLEKEGKLQSQTQRYKTQDNNSPRLSGLHLSIRKMGEKYAQSSISSLNKKQGGFRACMFVFVLGALENIGFIANTSTMGLVLFTIHAYLDKLHPCKKSTCVKGGEAIMFYVSICLLALGASGVKGSVPALGADQFNSKDPKGLIAEFIGFVVLVLERPFYCFQPLATSPLIKISQVIVVAIRNRKLSLPENDKELYEIEDKERDVSQEAISHTSQFRSLDKAAVLQQEMSPEPWKVCTVTQVEEVKILTRMLPILARKLTGNPSGFTQLQRVGIGLVPSIISMGIAGMIVVKRRDQALLVPPKKISLFWLSLQCGVFGIAYMLVMAGLMEFFYKEAPKGMRSLATSFALISLSFGYFLSTALVSIVNSITKMASQSKQGWLEAPDLNQNKLEHFYWFLAILSLLNFANCLYWASWYKSKSDANDTHETEANAVNGP